MIIRDEWKRWQQGMCMTYAAALMSERPSLRMGVAGYVEDDGWSIAHFYAHDDTHAYDSAGIHPLPYLGVDGQMTVTFLDQVPDDYGTPESEEGATEKDLADALAHAKRNGILTA